MESKIVPGAIVKVRNLVGDYELAAKVTWCDGPEVEGARAGIIYVTPRNFRGNADVVMLDEMEFIRMSEDHISKPPDEMTDDEISAQIEDIQKRRRGLLVEKAKSATRKTTILSSKTPLEQLKETMSGMSQEEKDALRKQLRGQ